MRKALFTILTSLFVSFMTLQASYATGNATGNNLQTSPAGDCTTVEMILENIKDHLEQGNGTFEVLSEADTAQYIQGISDMFGTTPPYPITKILLVKPKGDADYYNVGYFDGNCFLTRAQLPIDLVNTVLKRTKS